MTWCVTDGRLYCLGATMCPKKRWSFGVTAGESQPAEKPSSVLWLCSQTGTELEPALPCPQVNSTLRLLMIRNITTCRTLDINLKWIIHLLILFPSNLYIIRFMSVLQVCSGRLQSSVGINHILYWCPGGAAGSLSLWLGISACVGLHLHGGFTVHSEPPTVLQFI